jgi:hypothetical protein
MPTDVAYASSTPAPSLFHTALDVEPIARTTLDGVPTALVIDLNPVLGVRLAASLSRPGTSNVVIILPRWPHALAILPTDTLISALIEESANVCQPAAAQHVIFVLDGERSRRVRRPTTDPRIDNRYDLAVADLPNLRQLQAAGIERIVKLSPSRSR